MSGPASMLRREKAAEKAKRKRVQVVKYQVDNGDIVFLEGPYGGKYVSQLFQMGPAERDYVVNNLWFTNDARVMEILKGFVCK